MGGGASSRRAPTLALMGMQMPSVLLARRRPGLPRVTSWASLGWVGAILATSFGAFAAVQLTGGSPNAFNNLGYISIALAAYRFGLQGGPLAGILFGGLVGPFALSLGVAQAEPPSAWITRLAAYGGIGLLLGWLFDTARGALADAHESAERVVAHQRDTMLALARTAEAKDTDTGEHIQRVQVVSEALARAVGLPEARAAEIGWAAMLHDLGKLHVPDAILLKPGPPDPEEWEILRRHPVWGAEILGDIEAFALAKRIARWHHEDFDGSGYPDGLRGVAIPFEARIVRIADSFDAITNDRPYRAARSIEEAIEELGRCAGRQFDPDLVDLTIELLRGSSTLLADIARISLRDRGRFT